MFKELLLILQEFLPTFIRIILEGWATTHPQPQHPQPQCPPQPSHPSDLSHPSNTSHPSDH